MNLDIKTLFLLTIYVEAVLGLLLLFTWIQNPGTRAVAWWGTAHLLRSVSVMLFGLYGDVPELVSIDLASAILFVSYAVTWTGARLFNGRPVRPGTLMTGATIWLMVNYSIGSSAEGADIRLLVGAGIVAAFSWATAHEFWLGRGEPLISRWPAILILFAHGVVALLRAPVSQMMPWVPADPLYSSAWLAVVSVESVLFPISMAFILLAMAKERVELGHKTAAMHDPLTGLVNRRGFFEQGSRLTRRQVSNDRPVAVFMIDLDHFKTINDQYGHQIGDRVLQTFARSVSSNLRSTDLIGRIGGEEFAVVLADAERDNAYIVAERIRQAFMNAAVTVDGHPIAATASIGVSVIRYPNQTLTDLLAEADHALYQAKARGRNRVELAPIEFDDVEFADENVHGESAEPAPRLHVVGTRQCHAA